MHNLVQKNEPAGIIHFPFIQTDLKNMALILQHYWQSVNTCPNAVSAKELKQQLRVSLSVRTVAKLQTSSSDDEQILHPVFPPQTRNYQNLEIDF